jgi:predicted nucleic acid-binding protein
MTRIILDTNILISGMAFNGLEKRLLNTTFMNKHTLVLSEYII